MASHFSDYENDVFNSLDDTQKQNAFFDCWTRKEAYIKATGEGLSASMRAFDVTLAPDEPPRILRIDGSADEVSLWSLEALEPAPDHIAALAVRQCHCNIEYYDWAFE